MSRVSIAVVGVGSFGRVHAQQLAANPHADLLAVVDIDKATARAVGSDVGCESLTNHRQLFGRVDAATIAAPTPQHFAIARDLIEAGIHVLVEKPMTLDVASAQELTRLAERHNTVLQVGHIERFSACFRTLEDLVEDPLYFESYRIAPWRKRGTDVDVIFDLMIHDIDIILGLARSPVTAVSAVGTPLFSQNVDIANARISFESGCVANVTASRVSHKMERSLRVFQREGYTVCDFVDESVHQFAIRGDPVELGADAISRRSWSVPRESSLANEINAFLDCIATGGRPAVDGRAGLEAVQIATLVNDSIRAHRRGLHSVEYESIEFPIPAVVTGTDRG